MTQRQQRLLGLWLGMALAGVATAEEQPDWRSLLRVLPENETALNERIAEVDTILAGIDAQLADLADLAADQEPKAGWIAKRTAWTAYRAALAQAGELRADIARLTALSESGELTAELEAIAAETAALQRRELPTDDLEAALAEARQRAQALDARINALTESQQRRQTFRNNFDAEQQRVRARITELTAPPVTTDGEAPLTVDPASDLAAQLPAREVQLAELELQLRILTLRRERAELALIQDGGRLEALQEQRAALAARVERLAKAWSAQVSAAAAEAPDSPIQPIKAFIAQAQLELNERRWRVQDFGAPGTLEAGALRPAALVEEWRGLADPALLPTTPDETADDEDPPPTGVTTGAFQYQSGRQLARFEQRLTQDLADLRTYLRTRRDAYSKALSQLGRFRALRESALNDLRDRIVALEGTAGLDATQWTQVRTEIRDAAKPFREALEDKVDRARAQVRDTQRPIVAAQLAEQQLLEIKSQLRLARLVRRTAGLLGVDWTAVNRELTQLRSEAATGGAEGERVLTSERDTARPALGRLGGLARDAREDLPNAVLAYVAGAIVGAALLGFGVTWLMRRRSIPLARGIEAHYKAWRQARDAGEELGSGVSGRLNLLVLNVIGDLAVPWLITAALITLAFGLELERALVDLGIVFLWGTVGAWTAVRLIHHLFEAKSAPHRPIPCDDEVAAHYRHWLAALIIFAAAMMTPVALLGAADVLPELADALTQAFKLGVFVGLLLFLYRKRYVIGLFDQLRPRWLRTAADVLYPLVVVGVLTLIVLQIIGFSFLVTYLSRTIALSLFVLLSGLALAEYLIDVLTRAGQAQPGPVFEVRGGKTRLRMPRAELSPYVRGLLKAVIRVAVLFGALAALIVIWDVPLDQEFWTWRKAALAAVTIVLALIVDRLITAATLAMERGNVLPASTSGFLQRIARGLLFVLVGLGLAVIAEWDVTGVWTLLSTLLAMVAIGFVAVWSILSNVTATLVILIWRPFNVGEWVTLKPEDIAGEVIDINFIYTLLKDEEGQIIAVPNNLFAQKFIARQLSKQKPERTLAEQLDRPAPFES